jgi:dimethylargininase
MGTRFTRAIVRPPCANFAQGISTAADGPPDLRLALEQHARYCEALQDCGLQVICLEPDPQYPDGTFVEDTAVVTERGAILARPGAPSRAGEVAGIGTALRHCFSDLAQIAAPGTLDGGDICQVDEHFLIGVSARTNEQGAEQLAAQLRSWNYTASIVDIRSSAGLLHLKTGIAYLGDGLAVKGPGIEDGLLGREVAPFRDTVVVSAEEGYAANCVRINDGVLLAAGYPRVRDTLERKGCRLLILQMSEFRKMDGGLSCLSLRF